MTPSEPTDPRSCGGCVQTSSGGATRRALVGVGRTLIVFQLAACTGAPAEDLSSDLLSPVDTATRDVATGDSGSLPRDVSGLYINEFMAFDTDDGFAAGADWVEIYNETGDERDLSRLALWANDGTDQYPWLFPEGAAISAGAFLVVVCDGTNQAGETLHASFRIGREDGRIELTTAWSGATLDSVTYAYQTTGLSAARTVDGGAEWIAGVPPTPGATNE